MKWEGNKKPRSAKSDENLKNNATKGNFSFAAQKRLRNSINWLVALSYSKKVVVPSTGRKIQFKLNLITLTLPVKQMHDDRFIKSNMLDGFLERLRKNHGMNAYMWRAEVQTKRTQNIHFHITTNTFVDMKQIRDYWNFYLDKYGYIAAYTANTGKTNPPSTEIKSVKKVRDLARYLSKYLAKNTPNAREITGRQWYCSSTLSKLKPITYHPDTAMNADLTALGLKWQTVKDVPDTSYAYHNIFEQDTRHLSTIQSIKDYCYQHYAPIINPEICV